MATSPKKEETDKETQPRLLHPILLQIPQPTRFLIAGGVNNMAFVLSLGFLSNPSVLGNVYSPSTLYSLLYFLFIPVGHAVTCLLVFGWPDPYFPNLLSNVPIGLTAMALGAYITGYFDRIGFDATAHEVVKKLHVDQILFPGGVGEDVAATVAGFYTNIVVLVVTGVWTYVLTNMVMSMEGESKKEGGKVDDDDRKKMV